MKKIRTFLAVLLAAMSTSSVVLAGDSLTVDSKMKVVSYSYGKSDSYRLIYSGNRKQNVSVALFDEKGFAVHRGYVKVDGGFAQVFDFSALPSGFYTFEVEAKGEKSTQTVHHVLEADRIEKALVLKSNADTRKMVLRSSELLKSPISIAIYGASDELLFQEKVEAADFLTRVYDLSRLQEKGVRFTISYNNKLIKDQKFTF